MTGLSLQWTVPLLHLRDIYMYCSYSHQHPHLPCPAELSAASLGMFSAHISITQNINADIWRLLPSPAPGRELASAWLRSQECLAHKTRILSARVFAWEIGTNRSGRWRAAPPSPARYTLNCPNINLEQLSWSGALSTQGFTPSYNSYNDINIKDTEKTSKTRDMWQIQTAKSNIYFESIKKNHKSANNDSKYNIIPTERI